jgi:hypothetical protein
MARSFTHCTIDHILVVAQWNVGGIIRYNQILLVGGLITEKGNKLHDQNYIDQIKEFDIVLLSETHVGYETTVDVENCLKYPVPLLYLRIKNIK